PSLFSFLPPAPPLIHSLSLHDALPIFGARGARDALALVDLVGRRCTVVLALRCGDARARVEDAFLVRLVGPHHQLPAGGCVRVLDRKSTRLNSSHLVISYAVFCLKKKR